MHLSGIHHLTAITANAPGNHAFYTRTLGMRLVKKTVNQDDTSAYHLFYADGVATPGTEITFFDWPAAPEQRGTHSVAGTGLRVASEESLSWWLRRLKDNAVKHEPATMRDGRATIDFEDPEGQRLSLVADTAAGRSGPSHPWEKSPVPAEHQILGLGPITLSVPSLEPTERVLTRVLEMRRMRVYERVGTSGGMKTLVYVFEMGAGGAAAELHVAVEPDLPPARQGAGGVHHVAFRTPDVKEHDAWIERLASAGVPSSGAVERYYFRSLYFREPNGILFEIATDGPGFAVDEPLDALGESLALPPFLEPRRKQIEANLKPLETTPSAGVEKRS